MAAHSHVWEFITLADGARARVCLCGDWRVQFAAELPSPVDIYSETMLDLLEREGTDHVEPVADPQSD
jgi:hypothetical protein